MVHCFKWTDQDTVIFRAEVSWEALQCPYRDGGKRCGCVSTHPSRNDGGGASRHCDPIYFLFHKSRIYLCFFTRTVKPPPHSLHHKRRELALVTANSILYLDSSRFCESLAKVFKDTLFVQSPGVCAHEPLPLPVPSRVVLLNTRI